VIAKTTTSVLGHEDRVDALIAALPATAWRTRSAGQGSKGDRRYAWARARINGTRDPDAEYWVLARRSPTKPTELAYYLCHAPKRVSLDQLVRVAGRVGDRGNLPDRERPDRPGPLPSSPVHRLVPAHHPLHARPRLPDRDPVKKGPQIPTKNSSH
jgi:hypothetical protein